MRENSARSGAKSGAASGDSAQALLPGTVPPDADPRVRVLLPLPLREAYDYRVPAGMTLVPGDYVEVPLGPRRVLGVVWGDGAGVVEATRLKPVVRRFDVPPMPEVERKFVEWVAAYTMTPPGHVLRMAISVPSALEPAKAMLAYLRKPDAEPPPGFKMTEPRRRVLALLDDGPPRTPAELAEEAGCGVTVVRGLAEAGLLEPVLLQPTKLGRPDCHRPGPTLSADQEAAAADLRARVESGVYSTVLLDGVTGSGKTEVYYEAIAAALKAGKQALVLLPEIALSAQWLERFARRFGAPPAEWHSELTGAQRRDTWRAVANGEVPVVVGARSALFLPYKNLGVIIIDEEHDSAYKQEEGSIYHARDMAVARAHLGGIPTVLVSATPSLETKVNADSNRYARIELPGRHGGAVLPDVELVDLRKDRPPARHWLAPSLKKAIEQTLAEKEQVMLFLNRRGYAPLTLCRACGHRLQCPNCTAWLVEHRLARKLQCHHCGLSQPLSPTCPECGEEGTLAACGPGVERIAEEVAELFPDARAAIMASDTLFGPRAIQEMVRRIADHELDILIGTQVMAKGHHFPMLTLVGVVDADLGLAGGDLRAGERTYQLLHQVAGRAGRGERPGRVMLQTYMPEHPVMQALAAGDRDGFYQLEAEMRLEAGMPPFGRLAALIVSGEDAAAVEKLSIALGRAAPRSDTVAVLGPAPAPLALLRGRHRRRLLLKAPRTVQVQPLIARWLEQVDIPPNVRVQVDVDPYSFL
ncbi:primosomal protein N' [Azospirillum brasilense]|uniref:Replication restart protein PriA n=2 Tax=Azospirillum brasilense TaxID=192 RepID=A0A4D8QHB8_AZOBR|nr:MULTISPECIES: primosomal protein N' [Azospirillum]MDW7552461.1 primosomal protein N' [Azospirillum brasilense]MDW7592349.1 primosomal protein N' [Azospirillum brasilense]MDW7627479.1 primosomal protein N' [Azospirillum brasilense]MDW7628956.1 primosomal protein N' [Azospirillum brasilense]MDX5954832.1 primosomal protein N' [Azospirillum brasilense]